MSREERRRHARASQRRRTERTRRTTEQNNPNYFKNFIIAVKGLFSDVANLSNDKPSGRTGRGRRGVEGDLKRKLTLAGITLASVVVLAFAIYGIVWGLTNKNAQNVYFNGESIGIVSIKDKDINAEYIQMLAITKLKADIGVSQEIQISDTITTELVHANKKDLVSVDYVVGEIYKNFDYKVEAYSISVDGMELATARSIADVNEIYEKIKSEYYHEELNITKAEFVEDVRSEIKYVKLEALEENNKIIAKMTRKIDTQYVYTAIDGDSYYGISAKSGLSLDEIQKLNPNINMNAVLKPGDKINLVKQKPLVSVRTYERKTTTEVIPSVQEIVYNPSEYKTYTKVLQPGSDGQREVTNDIVRVDDLEVDRIFVSENILTPAVNEKVEQGTSNTPPKRALGIFVMPAYGQITEYFNARGGNHDAVDIANKSGTSVMASDGGKVTVSENSGDGYGLKIIIDHGNGFNTLYAHCSKLLVSAGDMVSQGQVIARMGSTGNSTGNHLHFELIKDGVKVNPFNYIE